jgi:hypothetical protein
MAAAVVSVLDYGADPTARSDSAAAIEAALGVFSGRPASGVVRIPAGVYRISRPLVYRGSWPHGLRIEGDLAAAGPAGAVLLWGGGPGAVLELAGCNATTVERVAISGAGRATTGIAVSYDHARGQGTTNVTLRQCHVGDLAAGPDSAAIRIGYRDGLPDDHQCDSIVVDRCVLVGGGGGRAPGYGVLTGVGNVKNFVVRDGSVSGFRAGVRHGGSGFMAISGCYFGANSEVDVWGAGDTIEVRSCDSEGSARLFRGTMGANPGAAVLSKITWSSGVVPPDGVVVAYGGYLRLEGCQLWNRRTDGSVPWVQAGPARGVACTLDSAGNFFARATRQPFIDGSRNSIVVDQPFYRDYPAFVRSFGDYGGVPGALIPFAPLPAPSRPGA